MHHITLEQILLRTIVACSLLHNFLPPWDFLDDFPRAQKIYKIVVYVIGYIALNARSTVYRSISTQANGAAPPAAPAAAPPSPTSANPPAPPNPPPAGGPRP